MKIPKEIAEKVEQYQKLYNEIVAWFDENIDIEGYIANSIRIEDKPKGVYQGEGEYCDQKILGEDWYSGTYYHQIECENKYVAYDYED